jgi:mRNA interferase RelE/StbE
VTWNITVLPAARKPLGAVRDRSVQRKLEAAVLSLSVDPHLRGKPLLGEMLGYRSLRAAGQRYRIIYRIDGSIVTVVIVTVGRRKAGDRRDLYELARKLIRLGLAEPPGAYRVPPKKKKAAKVSVTRKLAKK